MSSHEIKQQAIAGTLESSDVQIMIAPNNNEGIQLELSSSVEKQYGDEIKAVILDTLDHLGVKNATLQVEDKGALDCTIKARVIGAVHRASDQVNAINWEEIDSWNA